MSLESPDPTGTADAFAAELRAVAHPIRLQILSLLTGAAMTATEVAQELGITHANASYHLRRLLVLHAVVVENEGGPGRGGSKRYRYDVEREASRPKSGGDRPLDARRGVYLVMAEELQRRVGMLATGRGAQADAELWVEPDVWQQATKTVGEVTRALHRAAKPPRTEGTIRTNSSIAMFVMEPK
jgi:DNA-binding transcriptional ArsR family regulator